MKLNKMNTKPEALHRFSMEKLYGHLKEKFI